MSIRAFLPLVVGILMMPILFAACGASNGDDHRPPRSSTQAPMTQDSVEVATLGGGCFWCIEAVFQRVDGVISVESGYTGGTVEKPSYKQVCTGTTGHAEVVNVTFDPRTVSFDAILQIFFAAHDPTTLNRQGNDVGTQYRSAIFTHSAMQDRVARAYIQQLDAAKTWPDPIVTQVTPFTVFYPAEDYHQNYFNENGSQPYCAFVVRPKVEKFLKMFPDNIKSTYKPH